MPKTTSKVLIILAFIAIYFIWGSTYMLNKIAVEELPPLMLSSFRFTTASILIFIIAKFMKLPLSITKRQFLNCAIVGFLFLVYGNGVFVWALKYLDSGFAALLAASQPLFVLLLMRILDKKTMKPKSIIGVTLGFIGMYLLVSQKELSFNEGSAIGVIMVLTCVLGWSYASIYVSKANLPPSYFISTAYQMLTAGIMLACFSLLFSETWSSPLNWSVDTRWAVVLLIVFGGIVAFTAFNYLLKNVSPEKVATSAYVNPLIALFLGWYILDESLTIQSIFSAIILLTGVYFITSKK
ncbi:EamA family transporter [Pontimicrobium sp. MEBiC01747]